MTGKTPPVDGATARAAWWVPFPGAIPQHVRVRMALSQGNDVWHIIGAGTRRGANGHFGLDFFSTRIEAFTASIVKYGTVIEHYQTLLAEGKALLARLRLQLELESAPNVAGDGDGDGDIIANALRPLAEPPYVIDGATAESARRILAANNLLLSPYRRAWDSVHDVIRSAIETGIGDLLLEYDEILNPPSPEEVAEDPLEVPDAPAPP